jgi:hypothetical protein
MFELIRRTESLGRVSPTFDLICEENTTRLVTVMVHGVGLWNKNKDLNLFIMER